MTAHQIAPHNCASKNLLTIPRVHAYDRLPFVELPADEPRNFWSPRPTGDYTIDCDLGEQYGEAALPMLREPGGAQLLRSIVLGMVKSGSDARDRGLIVGMMGVLGAALERAAPVRSAVA